MLRTARTARGGCSPQQIQKAEGSLDEIESLVARLHVDPQTASQLLLIDKLEQVLEAVIEPPRGVQSGKEVLVVVATVVTSGTPVQGPNVRVGRGHNTVVRQRRHSGTVRTGYVAFERSDTGNSQNRMEFRDNDSIALSVRRLDSLWFDADNNATSFELIVAYGPPQEID